MAKPNIPRRSCEHIDDTDVISSEYEMRMVVKHLWEGDESEIPYKNYLALLRFLRKKQIPHLRQPSDYPDFETDIDVNVTKGQLSALCDFLTKRKLSLRSLHIPVPTVSGIYITHDTPQALIYHFTMKQNEHDSNL